MNKYESNAKTAELQAAAYQAARDESNALDSMLAGKISESDYMAFAAATEAAVSHAVARGVSIRDLPAV